MGRSQVNYSCARLLSQEGLRHVGSVGYCYVGVVSVYTVRKSGGCVPSVHTDIHRWTETVTQVYIKYHSTAE